MWPALHGWWCWGCLQQVKALPAGKEPRAALFCMNNELPFTAAVPCSPRVLHQAASPGCKPRLQGLPRHSSSFSIAQLLMLIHNSLRASTTGRLDTNHFQEGWWGWGHTFQLPPTAGGTQQPRQSLVDPVHSGSVLRAPMWPSNIPTGETVLRKPSTGTRTRGGHCW